MNRKIPRRRAIRPSWILAAILFAAFVVRVIFLVQLERSELGDVLSLDSQVYYDVARNISGGGALPRDAFTFNPLYPAFLVFVFRIFGVGLLAPRIIQLAIGLFTIVLVYLAGRRLVPPAWEKEGRGEAMALVAAAMSVLYAQLVLYEGMLLASTLEIFFFTASFALALALDDDLKGERPVKLGSRRVPPWASGLVLGALLGAGALGRPNLFLLLVAAIPVWLWARNRGNRVWLIPAAALLAGAALFLAPPIVYNAKATGRLVPVTAHGGFNFFLGNGPGSTGVYLPPADMRSSMKGVAEDAKTKAEAETGRPMTQAEASDYYVRATLKYIADHPATWLRLIGKKLVLFFNVDVPDMPNVYYCMNSCGVLKLLFVPFPVIAPLAICGFLLMLRAGRRRSVLSLFLACAVVSVIAFYVNPRYRLPAAPLFILFASFFIAWAAREISQRRLKAFAGMSVLAVALYLFVSSRPLMEMNNGAAYSFLGKYYKEHKNEEKAQEAFEQAYRADPNKVEAMISYARILRQRGQQQEAADMFARAYARSPRFPLVAIEYGMALDRLGRSQEAKKLYLEGSSADRPTERALACRLLARSAIAAGDHAEAIKWVKRALVEVPGEPELTKMLKGLEGGR
jgi:4-amino-4-deoxy-L-arabinose transferase-like glycosyltransferase/Flp pilus assembly protein TadD